MTLQEVLEVSLRRVGLTETATDFKDQARLYANIVAKDIIGESNWWWARRTGTFSTTRRITVTVPSTVSSYQDGETVTTSGGYSATIKSWDSTNNYLYVYSENAVTPSGTLTGGTSGMTSTYSSREFTRTYLLSSDVDKVHYFVNETEGPPLSIIGAEAYVESDPERDDTGDAGAVVVEGLDSETNTGQIVVSLLPRHSTTNETIRYGYYLFVSDWTSSDDSTDLKRWIHPRVQAALVFGISRLYRQEKGDDEGSLVEQREYTNVINNAKKQNHEIQGNRTYRKQGGIGRQSRSGRNFNFRVTAGSLT